MDCFSFTAEITDERTLMLPTGSAIGRGPVAITPAWRTSATPGGEARLGKHSIKYALAM
jgi:hypothetical protein